MRTRTKLLWLGGAGFALLLLTYLAAEHADMLTAVSFLLFVGVAVTFSVVGLRAGFRWGRAAAGRWRASIGTASRVPTDAGPLPNAKDAGQPDPGEAVVEDSLRSNATEQKTKAEAMVEDSSRSRATEKKSEAEALLDKFVGDS